MEARRTDHAQPNGSTTSLPSDSAPLLSAQPVAPGGASINEDAEDKTISLLAKQDPFITSLAQEAALPARYQILSHHSLALFFSAACAASASFLYIDGSESEGKLAIAGGVTVNLTQNLLYGVDSYYFIKNALQHFRQKWGRLISATLLASLATAPTSISTDQLDKGSDWQTTLTTVGNLPINIYGMYLTINRFLEWRNENPEVRNFLQAEFENRLPARYLGDATEEKRDCTTNTVGYSLGFVLGLGLVASQFGYLCSSAGFLEQHMDKRMGIGLGILANSPSLAVAMLVSGMDLGKLAVNFAADSFQYVVGNKKLQMSTREKVFCGSFAVLLGASSYLAYYSSATSKSLFDQSCPDFGYIVQDVLKDTVDIGTCLFNGIMSGIAIKETLNYLQTAYAQGEDKEHYQVAAMARWIRTSPRRDLEALAKKHFPLEKEWKKVETACCGRRAPTLFARPYHSLENGEAAAAAAATATAAPAPA